jgi:hypothetical protein
MMDRKSWILALISLLLIPIGFFTLRTLEWLVPSFPELFFGQLRLTRNSSSLSPKSYQSVEFVWGQVSEEEIKNAYFIHIQDDVLFWDPHYPGFPRTELSLEEVRLIQEVLAGGMLFEVGSVEEELSCLEISPEKQLDWVDCPAGGGVYDQFNDYRFEAFRKRGYGLLMIHLTEGRIVEIRIAQGYEGFAFEPYEKSGPWWFDGVVNQPFPLLDELAARAEVEPIEVLWPNLDSERANAKAGRILGKSYKMALDAVHSAPEVQEVYGEIIEIRPALGDNSYSSWMDSTCATLTLYVRGTKGEGAVNLRGLNCFDIRMVVDGAPVQNVVREACP